MGDLDLVRTAAVRLEVAEAAVADAVVHAREAGATWDELAEVLGVAATTVQRRYGTAEVRRRRSQTDGLANARAAERRVRAPGPRGVGVTEAAERLGVSRQTVWRRLRSGDLERLADGSVDPRSLPG